MAASERSEHVFVHPPHFIQVTPRPKKRREFWQRTCRELVEELGIKFGLSHVRMVFFLGTFSIFLWHIIMEEQAKNN